MTNLIQPSTSPTPITPKPKQATWRRLARMGLIGIGSLWLLSELCFPFVIERIDVKKQLQQGIEKETGAIVSFQTLALHWVPWQGVWIAVKEPTLSNPQHKKLVEGKEIAFRVDYGSLFWGGKANLSEVVIQSGKLDLSTPADWTFYQPKSDKPPDWPTWIEAQDLSVNLDDLKLKTIHLNHEGYLKNERRTAASQLKNQHLHWVISNSSFTMRGVDLLRLPDKMPHNAWLETRLNVTVSAQQKVADLSLQGKLNGADVSLSDFTPPRLATARVKIPRLSGTLTLSSLDLSQLKALLPNAFQEPLKNWRGVLPKAVVKIENGALAQTKRNPDEPPSLLLSAQVFHHGENTLSLQGKTLPKAQLEAILKAKALTGTVSLSRFQQEFSTIWAALPVQQIRIGIRKSDDFQLEELQKETLALEAQDAKGMVLSKFLQQAAVSLNLEDFDLKHWQDVFDFVPELKPLKGARGQIQLRLNQNGVDGFAPKSATWQIHDFSVEKDVSGLDLNGLNTEGTWTPQQISMKADANSLLRRPFHLALDAKTSPAVTKIHTFKLDWQKVALADVCHLAQEKPDGFISGLAFENLACRGYFSSTLHWQNDFNAPVESQGRLMLEDANVFFQGQKQHPVSVVSHLNGSMRPVPLPSDGHALKWQLNGQVLSGQLSSQGQILPEAKQLLSRLTWHVASLNSLQKNVASILQIQKTNSRLKQMVAPLLTPDLVAQGKLGLNGAARYTWDAQPARFDYDFDVTGSDLSVAMKGEPALIQQGQFSFKSNDEGALSAQLTGKALQQPIQLSLRQGAQNAPGSLEIDFPRLDLESLSSQFTRMKHMSDVLPDVLNPKKMGVFALKEMSGKGEGHLRVMFPKGIQSIGKSTPTESFLPESFLPDSLLPWQARLNLAQLKVKLNAFNNPLEIHQIQLAGSQSTGLSLAPTRFKMGEFAGNVALVSQPGKKFKLALDTDKTSLASIREFIESWDTGKTGIHLPQLWQVTGDVQLSALVMNHQTQLKVQFEDAGASWQGGDFPVYQVNGSVILDESGQLTSPGLTGRYANSPFEVGFQYHPHSGAIKTQGQLDASPLLLTHMLIPRDMTHWLESSLNSHFALEGALPNPAHWPSEKNELSGNLQAAVPSQLKLSTGVVNLFDLTTQFHLKGEALDSVRGRLNILETGGIDFKGFLENLTPQASQERAMAFQLKTPAPIDLSAFSERVKKELGSATLDAKTDWVEGLQGKLQTDMQWQKDGEGNGDITGFVNIDALAVPRWDLSDLTMTMGFQGQSGELDLKRFAIPGADLAIQAMTENVLQFPVHLEQVRIHGQSVNLSQMSEFVENVFVPRIQNGVLLPVLRPPKAWEPLFPVEFRGAEVSLDEMIYQNIILRDFKGELTTFSSGFTELRHVKFNAAGGEVEGSMAMNPRNQNFFTLELYPKNVKANALSRALLKQSNILYGDVNGVIRFTTQGLTNDDMIKNANGVAQLSIENGRLPQIARIETLLTGANILRGGIVGLNLNNLIRAIQPFETNYFSKLTGEFQIASGVLYTNNLSSDGENLDLDIGGWIRLLDGVAALEVTGAMSQDVSGVLGHLGKFSVGRLIRYIPGLGFLPNSRTGLLGIIPGIGFVPGFGGPAQDINRFQIRVRGPLDDPSSIKGMKWLQDNPNGLNSGNAQP